MKTVVVFTAAAVNQLPVSYGDVFYIGFIFHVLSDHLPQIKTVGGRLVPCVYGENLLLAGGGRILY